MKKVLKELKTSLELIESAFKLTEGQSLEYTEEFIRKGVSSLFEKNIKNSKSLKEIEELTDKQILMLELLDFTIMAYKSREANL